MKKQVMSVVLGVALSGLLMSAQASGLGDMVKGQLGGAGDGGSDSAVGSLGGASALSSLGVVGSGTASNAAGVITYCMKNNYLNADKAAQVKDQLLGKMGLGQKEEPKDEGYASGLSGMIKGSDGKSFNLDSIKGQAKEKACDFVLNNAKSLL